MFQRLKILNKIENWLKKNNYFWKNSEHWLRKIHKNFEIFLRNK